jgi:PTH1 family peptidyl-tRNA hydrolase
MDPAEYVLREFSAAERADLGIGLEDAADAVEMLISDGLLATQNKLH